uniref:Uncharacterized protein n=1 Tax=Oryza brachyantha TaxID=4533 RepID=J3MZ24_ORYBR
MGGVPDFPEEQQIIKKATHGRRRPTAGHRRSGRSPSAAVAIAVVVELCPGRCFRRRGGGGGRRSQQWQHQWCSGCLSKRGLGMLKISLLAVIFSFFLSFLLFSFVPPLLFLYFSSVP